MTATVPPLRAPPERQVPEAATHPSRRRGPPDHPWHPFRLLLDPVRWHDGHARLAAHPAFARCSRPEIRRIYRMGEDLEIPASTQLLAEDRIGYWFLAVLDGAVTLTRKGRTVATLGPGGHVGEVAIIGFGPQPATVTTAVTTRVFLLGRRELVSLAHMVGSFQRGIFPDVEPAQWRARVAMLRAEGTAAWSRMPRRPYTAPVRPAEALPRSIRVIKPTRVGSETPLAKLASAFVRATPQRTAVPVRVALGWRVITGLVAAGAALCGFALLRYHPPVAVVDALPPIDVVGDLRVDGVPVERPTGRYLLTAVSIDRPNLLGLVRAVAGGKEVLAVDSAPAGSIDTERTRALAREGFLDSQRRAVAVAADHSGIDPTRISVHFRARPLTGSSAGLVYALALADMLEPADIARGRVIAATGVIGDDGAVGPVRFADVKRHAAGAGHASVFLVPRGQERVAGGDFDVIGVATFEDALRRLAS